MLPIPKMPKQPKAPKANKASNEQPLLAIDWDGVIHDRANPLPGRTLGEPLPGAIDALQILKDQGYRICVHTCVAHTPAGYKAVVDWLDYYRVPYHEVTSVKPVAKLYIDDKALHHTDWDKTLIEIEDRLNG